jgi:hypothetical protein
VQSLHGVSADMNFSLTPDFRITSSPVRETAIAPTLAGIPTAAANVARLQSAAFSCRIGI